MSERILTVIVTFNGKKWVERCISSVRNSSLHSDIFVVDNGSTDSTVSTLKALAGDDLFITESETNLGFGKANNLGMEYAIRNGYDFIYLLNQDAWVSPNTFRKLVDGFRADPSLGIISPLQMTADLKKMDSQFQKQCGQYIRSAKSDIVEVPFVMAAHWMISAECVRKVGGFSPAFHLYGEDDNLIDRCHYKGFTVGVHTQTKAVHDRDNRPRPKQYRMKIKKTHAVKMMSDPNTSKFIYTLFTPLWMIGMGIYHLSWDMIIGAFSVFAKHPEIIRFRNESLKEGAFLNLP